MDRPRVVVSVCTSVDGRVTLRRDRLLLHEDAARAWRSLEPPGMRTAEAARDAQLEHLYGPQAVLEGSGSLVPEAAGPLTGLPEPDGDVDALYTDHLPDDVVQRPGREKWFTVVDGRGRIRWTSKREDGMDLLVLVSHATPAAYLGYLQAERICYLVAGRERVDLAAALARMRGRLRVTCIVSTAGGGLNGALLRADLVDELHLLVLPAAIGGRDTPALFDGPPLTDDQLPTRLHLLSSHAAADGLLWLRYEVAR